MKDDLSNTTVILPTLNEIENIKDMIRQLTSRYKGLSIIVADDGSTDGTREAVKEIHSQNTKVRLLDRTKKEVHGGAISVLDAISLVKTPRVVVMDADFQHPVEKIGEMAGSLSEYDLVIGVRKNIEDWSLWRRLGSNFLGVVAYAVFKARGKPTSDDMMSGLYAVRTELFKRILKENRGTFVPRGYKIVLDMLKVLGAEAKVGEVHYSTYRERQRGKSKMNIRHMFYTLVSIFK